jgi:CheY-like chemotaxis protein
VLHPLQPYRQRPALRRGSLMKIQVFGIGIGIGEVSELLETDFEEFNQIGRTRALRQLPQSCGLGLFMLRRSARPIAAVHACLGRAVPTFMLTGDTSSQRIQEASELGFPLLHKPVDTNALIKALAEQPA